MNKIGLLFFSFVVRLLMTDLHLIITICNAMKSQAVSAFCLHLSLQTSVSGTWMLKT